jgi:hypothetical protein
MANLLDIDKDENNRINEMLFKLFQSSRLNILIGSGASMPAITIAGNLEAEVQALYDADDEDGATKRLYDFLLLINQSTMNLVNKTPDDNTEIVQNGYKGLFKNIEKILNERRTNILPKQVNIFTTNYDVFIEDALENFESVSLNDGFERKPSLTGSFKFSTNSFSNAIFNSGTLYNYKVEFPSVNLYKLHGSMTWKQVSNDIVYQIQSRVPRPPSANVESIEQYNDSHALILPRKHKFSETVLQQVYYDLLRLYANELDKENTTLLVFGFSFADEHIIEITKRALKNPTLKIVIFAYNDLAKSDFLEKFHNYHNVDVIFTGNDEPLDFCKFNEIVGEVLPRTFENA